MTDIWVERDVRAPLTDEARAVAEEICERAAHGLDEGQEIDRNYTLTANEDYYEKLRAEERERQIQLGGESIVYFGTTHDDTKYLYEAMLEGYSPTEAQLKARDEDVGDHIYDGLMQLFSEHYDIYEVLHGKREGWTYGERYLPREEFVDVLGVLYMRGQDYRSFGWGFPWISDDIEEEM